VTDKETDAYRQEAVKQAIGLVAFLVTLIAYQATVDPVFREVWKARIRAAFGKRRRRDTTAEAVRQAQREISWMEHGTHMQDVTGAE
jgi:type II secretory pathway component PulM